MPDITKVSTPSSGAISFADLNAALRNTAGTEVSLAGGEVKSLLGISSGSVDMNSAYGAWLPYGEVVYSTSNSDDSDGPYEFENCDFGTDTDDRIILCVVTYYSLGGNSDYLGRYSLDTIASATIGSESATCAGRMDGYTVTSSSGHRQQMCVFYARPTGTSGSVVYSVNDAGWDNNSSRRAGHARTLTIYALYGLNNTNPIEYSAHTQKTDDTGGRYTLQMTLEPDNNIIDFRPQKDKLLLLLTGRHYFDAPGTTTVNTFRINYGSAYADWQNVGPEGEGAFGRLTYDVPTSTPYVPASNTFVVDSVSGDGSTSSSDLETTCFIGIIFAKNPTSPQTVDFAPSVPYVSASPPPPPPPPPEPPPGSDGSDQGEF